MDLLDSIDLDVDSLCKNQLEKFNEGQKFTYIGNILLSLNTLKDLEVYSSEVAQSYFNSAGTHNLPAHIYATAYEIFTTLMKNGNNQTVIPYGISGSGKSVCCQLLVQSLAELTCKRTSSNDMFKKLSVVGSFMDMFLNAKTNLNVNSTRCAKLIQMFISSSGICEGAFFSFYLLDKSRVSHLQTSDRNFHILYYMLAGLTDKERKLNLLDNPDKHKLVKLSDGSEIFKDPSYLNSCKQKWSEFNDYLNLFGFIPEERGSILAVLTGILHLKDLHFVHDLDTDGVGISNEEILDTASHMLGLNVDVLAGYLLTFEITIKGEKVCTLRSVEDVTQCNDALVADLYERLVNWIAFNINRILFPKIMRTSQYNRITILDAFGFEDNLKIGNHWQQLQINLFNEQMAYHYNKIIFRQPCEDYRVQTGDATYPVGRYTDNNKVMELLVNPGLLLNILNEESLDETSSDLELIQKFDQRLSNRSELNIVKEHTLLFSVNHTISNVTYSVHDFIKENRNRYENKFIDCFKKSESQFIVDIIQCKQLDDEISCLKDSVKRNRKSQFITETTNHKNPESKKKKNRLLSTKHKGLPHESLPKLDKHTFRCTLMKDCMVDLLDKKLNTDTFFIICITPNRSQSVNSFDEGFVRSQLMSLNVMHTINQYLLKPIIFIEFSLFVQKYKVLHFPLHSHVEATAINCLNILLSAGIADYKIGKNKVLLRYKQRTELDSKLDCYDRRVHTCQASIRGFVARNCYKQTLQAWRASNLPSQMKFKSGSNAGVCSTGRKDGAHHEDNNNYYVNVGSNNKRISSMSNKTEASAATTTAAATTTTNNENSKKYDENVYENVSKRNINTNHNIYNKPNPTHSKSENTAVKLYQKQIRNSVFFKNLLNESLKNFHKVNKEDWVKIFFFENDNRLISKFFCEEPQLSINNSEEEYNGKLIGLRTLNFAWTNSRTYSVLDSLKNNFDITKLDNGDVFARSTNNNMHVLVTYFSNNLHPDRSISVKNAKIFDMKLFRQAIKKEIHSSNFSVRNIEMCSMVLLNFFSTLDMNLQEEKVSMLLVFYHALDTIGDYEVYKDLIASDDNKHVPLEMWLKLKQTRR